MSDEIRITDDARKVLAEFERLPKEVQTAVGDGLERSLMVIETRFRANPGVRLTGSRKGLGSRLTHRVLRTGGVNGSLDGLIGFRRTRGFPYELSQEFGAKARAGGAMAIPVSDEAKKLSERGTSAKDFPRPLFPAKAKSNILVEHVGMATVVHYVLVKSIPARMRFRETVRTNLNVVSEQVLKAWRQR